MSIEVKICSEKDYDRWDSLIKKSEYGTIFHTIRWLKITEKYTDSKLFLLIAEKNDEIISIFPIFKYNKWGLNYILSPPEGGSIPFLGPISIKFPAKQSSFERLNRELIKKYQAFIKSNVSRRINYFGVKTLDTRDPRPFQWDGFEVIPTYTYDIRLDKPLDKILKSFSQTTRRYVNKNLKAKSLEVNMGSLEDAIKINNLVKNRYKDQGIKYNIKNSYLREIYEHFKDFIDVFVLNEDGNFVSGIIALKFNNSVGHWIGGTNPGTSAKDPISFLHWKIIENLKSRKIKSYDLFGANTEHLCNNKSKLNPELKMYFTLKSGSFLGKLGSKIYGQYKRKG